MSREEEAYQEALRRIREAAKNKSAQISQRTCPVLESEDSIAEFGVETGELN